MTTISVIMTCFNEGPYIGAAVDSILAQTRADLIEKVVIVDDGSESETLDVLRDIAQRDVRIEVIFSKGNGLPKARNLAAARVKSDWIAILDGDDIWLPERSRSRLRLSEVAPKSG